MGEGSLKFLASAYSGTYASKQQLDKLSHIREIGAFMKSPCIAMLKLDAKGEYCVGCGRTKNKLKSQEKGGRNSKGFRSYACRIGGL